MVKSACSAVKKTDLCESFDCSTDSATIAGAHRGCESMDREQMLREMTRTVEELRVFNEIGKALTSSLDIREVLSTIMQKISELLKPHNWSLLLLDDKTNELVFEVAVGRGADKLK
ncbi:MAG: hypothetical protein D6806_15160, partial [Deltaproteobacteria bacterium]